MVAENDLALGRLVEAIVAEPVLEESAIFVLEDDAQNGPDHVDSHRSPAFVVSPFTKRGAVDSTLYTTSGMLRTMELILGLPPMSQYDAAATPMYNAFQTTPVATPYTALPARVPLDEKNGANAWGAAASLAMNFDEADMTPEYELNEILWKSVRGADSPMPPPVRAGFIRVIDDDDEEEDKPAARTSPRLSPRPSPELSPGRARGRSQKLPRQEDRGAMTAIRSGTLTALFLYDVAEAARLGDVGTVVASAVPARLAPRPDTPAYIQYVQPPLTIDGEGARPDRGRGQRRPVQGVRLRRDLRRHLAAAARDLAGAAATRPALARRSGPRGLRGAMRP